MDRRHFLTLAGASALTSCAGPGGSFTSPSPTEGPFALGIDMLAQTGFAAVRGKRVGLITNQTSAAGNGTPTRLVLQRALGPALTALYTPEHGLDGKEPAGLHVATRRDPLTGLTAHSLYGATRKPSPAQLSNIDVLLYDLQGIGCRSYTYMSTMVLSMEACAEQGKEFMVLDRPNPLGGLKVQGPPLDPKWKSFVGQIPVPYVHGLTAGEMARMTAAKGWIKAVPRLRVIPMRGWQRWMTWRDTRLRWIPTSPNIPKAESPLYYAATGILGGLDGVDIGIGTSAPFEAAAGRGIDPQEFTAHLSRLRMPGTTFRPYVSQRKPGFAGASITIDPHGPTDLMALAVVLIYEVCRRTGGAPLRSTKGDTRSLFHKVYGSNSLYRDLVVGRPPGEIIGQWQGFLSAFRQERQRYLLY